MSGDGLIVRELETAIGEFVSKPLSFEVRNGEIAVVLGPNGSGKTTLLRTVAGLLPKRAGSVSLNGIEINYRPTLEPRHPPEGLLSIVFQDHKLVPHLDAFENVLLGVPDEERSEAESRALEIARFLDCESLLPRPARSLSFGEREKMAVLRALIPNCSALLMDEPTASLHPLAKEQVAKRLRSWVQQRCVPVLVATHDWPWARGTADKFIILDHSRALVAHSKQDALKILLLEDPDD
ncbi:MAG: iron(III) transport system ATP-binding protein [Sphingomonadales bacterium]|nr:iron(III) transport system ATP-binding protein [Sphingomonadales bacterium]